MTTTQSTPRDIATLAANLYQHAVELDEMPFVGTVPAYAALNEKLARQAVAQLHDYLTLVAEHLDDEWTEILTRTATYDAWVEYGA